MSKPNTLIRFYKPTVENLESLEKQYIYLFSAKQWKDAYEMQFEVDTNDPVALKQYVTEEIERAFSFSKDSDEYKWYFKFRHGLLDRHGRINLFTSKYEKDHLIEIVIKEISYKKIQESKKGLIRNNFFSKTGISCFTADCKTVEDHFHWLTFAGSGEGFCVEFDWPLLESFFYNNKAEIRGDFVRYYEKTKPKLILQSEHGHNVEENFHEIIFSLSQSLQNEKEFRLAKVYKEDIPDLDKRRKEQIPKDAIKNIFFGPKMIKKNKEQILKIIKSNLPNVQIYLIEDLVERYKPIPFLNDEI